MLVLQTNFKQYNYSFVQKCIYSFFFIFFFYLTLAQYELLKDHKALNTLRELLVIIRIWGLLRPSCLPVFLRSADNLDVLALLFRLLSKLIQPNGDTQTQQVDDGLIGKLSSLLHCIINSIK